MARKSDYGLTPAQKDEVVKALGETPEDLEAAKRRLPDAATTRAALVGILVFVGAAIGKPELGHNEWIDAFVSGYTATAPLVLGWFIARHRREAAEQPKKVAP